MAANLPDLQAAWSDACTEFKKATGINLSEDCPAVNDQDIIGKFNRIRAKDDEAHQKISKAKTAVSNTLIAINRVGQVAAQGASMVFGGPANIAMNCISFLIDAGLEYKNIAQNIDDLFCRIASVMERFQIYRNNEKIMEPTMIRMAHRLLMLVVSICALCIRKLNENSVKKFFGIALFSSDGGIKAQFTRLEALQDEESRLKGTITMVATEINKRNIEDIKVTETKIFDSVSELKTNSTDARLLEELRGKLDVDEESSKKEYRDCQDKFVSKSCAWLAHDSQYQSWSNINDKQNPLLVLKGEEGCGKSYTSYAILRDLMRRSGSGGGKKDVQMCKGGNSIRQALRAWALQIAINDIFYRKGLLTTTKQSPDSWDLNETWQKLFLDHLDKDTTYFLVLDGTHELEDKDVGGMITLVKTLLAIADFPCRLRLVVTARGSLVQRLITQVEAEEAVIELKDRSHEDLAGYILEKANALQIFQRKTQQVQMLKDRVCAGLVKVIDGSFLKADIKLREIGNKNEKDEILRIVEKGDDLDDSIANDIRECNRTLDSHEIRNLNTLLLWTMYSTWDLEVYELESVLFVRNGQSSLQPLSSEIKDKFSAFFELSDESDYVTLKHEYIAEYFKKLVGEQNSPSTTGPQTLTKGEIRMVQHFIRKLCDPDMYDRLGLENFFDQKLSCSDTVVSVDCDNAHTNIALGCLRCLTEEHSEEADGLTYYAQSSLTNHLKQIDLDCVDPHLKAELGPLLVKMFRNPTSIKRANERIQHAWPCKSALLAEVLRLFRSSAVMKRVSDSENKNKEWSQTVVNAVSSRDAEIALLKDALDQKTKMWLTTERWLTPESATDVGWQFSWVRGYYEKTSSDGDDHQIRQILLTNDCDAAEILAISKVAQDTIPSSALSATDLLINLGITYCECEHINEAINAFKSALALDSDHLGARASLACAYAEEVKNRFEPDWTTALHHLDFVIDRVKNGKSILSDGDPVVDLRELLTKQANWLGKSGLYSESCKFYRDLLREQPEDDMIRLDLIRTLCEAECYKEIVEMFQELCQEIDEETQRTCLSRFFYRHVHDSEYHTTIVRAFKQVGSMIEIKEHYRKVMSEAHMDKNKQSNRKRNYIYCGIIYFFAAMLYQHCDSMAEKEEAIQLWEQVVNMSKSNLIRGAFYLQRSAARTLASIYVAEAIDAGRDSAEAASLVKKIEALNSGGGGSDGEDWIWGLSSTDVRSMLGRYHSAVGNIDKAKELLRVDVEVGIKLLSDEDPDNDYQAYQKLASAFMDSGDDENAVAAWCMIQPTEGLTPMHHSCEQVPAPAHTKEQSQGRSSSEIDLQSDNRSQASTEKTTDSNEATDTSSPSPPRVRRHNATFTPRKPSGPLSLYCEGGCGTEWTYADNYYMCRDCIDVQFDADCINKLRRGEMDDYVCNPQHSFLYVPPWTIENFERAADKKIMVGDRIVDVEDWKEDINREWGLLEVGSGETVPVVVEVTN